MSPRESERWLREFGGHRLESVQWAEGGLLVESLGLVRLAFRLEVEGPALRLETVKVWVLGIRWPLVLAPRGSGVEIGQEDGCAIVARPSALAGDTGAVRGPCRTGHSAARKNRGGRPLTGGEAPRYHNLNY